MKFSAKSYDWRFSDSDTWVACDGSPVVIRMPPVIYSASFERALFGDLGTATAAVPDIASLRAAIVAAMQEGRHGEAASIANELSAKLFRAGQNGLAVEFSLAAMEGGFRAGQISTPEVRFAYDPGQNRWVMSPEGQDDLLRFQTEAGIHPTGDWDFRTFEAIRVLDLQGHGPEING